MGCRFVYSSFVDSSIVQMQFYASMTGMVRISPQSG